MPREGGKPGGRIQPDAELELPASGIRTSGAMRTGYPFKGAPPYYGLQYYSSYNIAYNHYNIAVILPKIHNMADA